MVGEFRIADTVRDRGSGISRWEQLYFSLLVRREGVRGRAVCEVRTPPSTLPPARSLSTSRGS